MGRAAERSGTRLAVGGAAVGALVSVAAMQLTSGLREDSGKPVVPSVCAPQELPKKTYAWLAEAPKSKTRPQPSARAAASVLRVERRAAEDAGTVAAPLDAGSEPGQADAGSETPP